MGVCAVWCGRLPNVSGVHPDFSFKTDPEGKAACSSEFWASPLTPARCEHWRVELTSSVLFQSADCCLGYSRELRIWGVINLHHAEIGSSSSSSSTFISISATEATVRILRILRCRCWKPGTDNLSYDSVSHLRIVRSLVITDYVLWYIWTVANYEIMN